MLKRALNILKDYNINVNVPFKEVILSNQTKEDNDTLYIKSIPDGLLYLLNKEAGKIKTNNNFKHVSTMIDLSRNAVMNMDYFKKTIVKHATLGYDEVWLYLEDTFEVKSEPKFGYMRGKYSIVELKEMVSFAKDLGITLIPCVQTLGHMGQFLRWFSSYKYRDTHDVLKMESELTYDFINRMIKTLKELFNTKKIHIGMDEAFGMGLGRFYKENGYKPQKDLFIEHLKKVNQIALDNGFEEVYIWSDMFFRISSVREVYYDPTITFDEDYINQIPKNVGLVYWDYYHEKQDFVDQMLEAHMKLNRKVIFASGTWTWTKLTYDKHKTDKTALVHIESSKKYNIEEICFTQWQDDGAYCDYESLDIGLFDIANAIADNSLSKDVFTKVSNKDYNKEAILSNINQTEIAPINLLWDDLLYGIYLNDFFGYDYEKFDTEINHYKNYISKLKTDKIDYIILDFSKLNLIKLEIRKLLLLNYNKGKPLKELYPLLDSFEKQLTTVIKRFKDNWRSRYKLNGLEVIEARLYVFYARIEDLKYMIELYDSKRIDKLDFLEEPLLKEPYLSPKFTDTFFGTIVH